MQRRRFCTRLLAFGAPLGASHGAWALGETEAAGGVRAALERGATVAVQLLGRSDGFLANPKVRIDLPPALRDLAGMLRAFGQQRRLDELVTAMNRAAEQAVPEARQLLVNAVRAMSVEDALAIVRGGDDAATRFFAAKTRVPLGERFRPIVVRTTERVALAAKYNALAGRAAQLGLLKQEDADLPGYVTGRALDGLYLVIGEEEQRIRRDPLGAGSELLRRVFGGLR